MYEPPATYGTYEAKAHFSELGDRAARGEKIIVTRNHKPWFMMTPIAEEDQKAGQFAERNRIAQEIIEMGKKHRAKYGPTTAAEIKALINEGRRF